MNDFKRSNEARQQIIVRLAQRIVDGSYFDGDYLMVNDDFLEAYAEMEVYFSPAKPNATLSNLEGRDGDSK